MLTGQLDQVIGTTIKGCAYDYNWGTPNVELYLDGEYYNGNYLATVYPGSSNNPNCYPSWSGFEYTIPAQYHDGQQHYITAYAWDNDYSQYSQLSESPVYFQIGSGMRQTLQSRVKNIFGNFHPILHKF